MSGESGRALVAALAVLFLTASAGVGVLLVSHPQPAPCATASVNGVQYVCLVAVLPLPPMGSSSTSPTYIFFYGMAFQLFLENWWSPGGGTLKGSGTEPNDSKYDFSIWGGPMANPPATWISPDARFGVQWDGSGANGSTFVNLLVRS